MHIYLIRPLIFFTLLIHPFRAYEFDSDVTVCNETIVVTGQKGHLKMPPSLDDVKCIWELVFNETRKGQSFYLSINELYLDVNDNFIVKTSKQDKTIYTSTGMIGSTILLTGASENITILLNTSKSNTYRKANIFFSSGDYKPPSIDIHGPGLLNVISSQEFSNKTKVIDSLEISFSLSPEFVESQLIHMGFTENVEMKIEGAQNIMDISETSFPDLISEKETLKLKFEKLSISNPITVVSLYYSLVTKLCSKYTILKDMKTNTIKTPLSKNLPGLTSIRCLWIFNYDGRDKDAAHFNIHYAINSISNDSLTIRNGNKETCEIMIQVNNQNKNEIGKFFPNTVSKKNLLFVDYYNPFFRTGGLDHIINLDLTPSTNGGYYNSEKSFNYKSSPDLQVYGFRANGKQAEVKFEMGTKLSAGYLAIIPSLNTDVNKAIVNYTKGQLIPDSIVVNGIDLRILIKGASDLSFSLKQSSNSCDIVASSTTSGSISLDSNHIKCNNTCTWLIPAAFDPSLGLVSNSIYTLHISSLSLISEKDCIKLSEYSTIKGKKMDLMTQCGKNGIKIVMANIPNLLLYSNSSYTLSYSRMNTDCNVNDVSIQASFVRDVSNKYTEIQMEFNGSRSLSTPTYPSYYPVYFKSDIINTGRNRWLIRSANVTRYFYMRFDDVDLAPGHDISLIYSGIKSPNKIKGGDLPGDLILQDCLLNLDSPLSNGSIVNQKLSGRGFNIYLEDVDAGNMIRDKEEMKTNGFPNTTTLSRYMWIVDLSLSKPLQILNLTLNWGKTGRRGNLTVFDNPSLRNNRTAFYNSSSNYIITSQTRIIVVYTSLNSSDNMMGLHIDYKVKDCPTGYSCDSFHGPNRCILNDWICNGKNECGNWKDETINCNSTIPPTPRPQPKPELKNGGVNGWVVAFVLMPLAFIVGVICALFGPPIIRKLRGWRTYTEFQDFSEVS